MVHDFFGKFEKKLENFPNKIEIPQNWFLRVSSLPNTNLVTKESYDVALKVLQVDFQDNLNFVRLL